MKLRMLLDNRKYAGTPVEIVTKLARDASFMPAEVRDDLDRYMENVATRMGHEKMAILEREGAELVDRCESFVSSMIGNGIAELVLEKPNADEHAMRVARRSLRVSQERFATLLGVSHATVNRWEKGHHGATNLAVLEKLGMLLREGVSEGATSASRSLAHTGQDAPDELNREPAPASSDRKSEEQLPVEHAKSFLCTVVYFDLILPSEQEVRTTLPTLARLCRVVQDAAAVHKGRTVVFAGESAVLLFANAGTHAADCLRAIRRIMQFCVQAKLTAVAAAASGEAHEVEAPPHRGLPHGGPALIGGPMLIARHLLSRAERSGALRSVVLIDAPTFRLAEQSGENVFSAEEATVQKPPNRVESAGFVTLDLVALAPR